MQRTFIFTTLFCKTLDVLTEERKLSPENFEKLEQDLLNNPKLGDVIPGMDGLRKVRLKGVNCGQRGGFRIDYLDFPEACITYFVVIYPKNVKADLSAEEKKIILQMIKSIKKGVKNG